MFKLFRGRERKGALWVLAGRTYAAIYTLTLRGDGRGIKVKGREGNTPNHLLQEERGGAGC